MYCENRNNFIKAVLAVFILQFSTWTYGQVDLRHRVSVESGFAKYEKIEISKDALIVPAENFSKSLPEFDLIFKYRISSVDAVTAPYAILSPGKAVVFLKMKDEKGIGNFKQITFVYFDNDKFKILGPFQLKSTYIFDSKHDRIEEINGKLTITPKINILPLESCCLSKIIIDIKSSRAVEEEYKFRTNKMQENKERNHSVIRQENEDGREHSEGTVNKIPGCLRGMAIRLR